MAQIPANERCSTAAPENSLPHSPRASVHTAWWGGERICYWKDNIRGLGLSSNTMLVVCHLVLCLYKNMNKEIFRVLVCIVC